MSWSWGEGYLCMCLSRGRPRGKFLPLVLTNILERKLRVRTTKTNYVCQDSIFQQFIYVFGLKIIIRYCIIYPIDLPNVESCLRRVM